METLFGVSMNILMYVLLGIVLTSTLILAALAVRNRVMLKMGLRPIPRRPGQTILIIIGVMLSTVIMAAAFGTGDTISFSIRSQAVDGLQEIDELIFPTRAADGGSFGAIYISQERLTQILDDLSANDKIDGIMPQIAASVPVQNRRTRLTEGQMNIVGLDPSRMDGFGGLALSGGGETRLDDLAASEAYLSENGVDELDARVGDEIDVFIQDRTETFTVKGVLERGGFAGTQPTMVMTLERAQALLEPPGPVNLIAVSNNGDANSGVDLSEEVTKDLRILFNDREVANQLKDLFNQQPVIDAVQDKAAEQNLDADLKNRLTSFAAELQKPELTDELNSLLADEEVRRVVLQQIEDDGLEGLEDAFTLSLSLSDLNVNETKRTLLDSADQAGSQATSFFLLFGTFSIIVGILLIFLIFVMLAAARKSEMGMARAVGAKRRHLMMMFAFEGTAYAIVSAAVGVLLGLGVSTLMVTALNQIFASVDEDFVFVIRFEPRSIIVAYCLGMTITFATVAVSAYRVSQLNIVVAIRDLPESIISKVSPTFTQRLLALLKALVLPLYYLFVAFRSLFRGQGRQFVKNLILAVVVIPVWFVPILLAVIRFIQPYLMRGWLVFAGGAVLTYFAIVRWERTSWFGAGMSLMILGFGLMLRWILRWTSMRPGLVDRIASTVTGGLMLAFWALPLSTFESIVGDLQGSFEITFVSGTAMVGAAVWTVMYNADLIVNVLPSLTSRIGRLRPVLVTAIAYPLSQRFRTGLTLAMFALVIFTLTLMSVLTGTFTTQFEEPRKVYMGFDVGGSVNFNSPIDDIDDAIAADPNLEPSDFDAVAGFTLAPIDLRQQEGETARWFSHTGMLLDDGFLSAADIDMKIIADGYGSTAQDVLDAMNADPTLAIVGGGVLPTDAELAASSDNPRRLFGDLSYDAPSMAPIPLDVREPRTGIEVSVTVIGVFDRVHADGFNVLASKSLVDATAPFPIPRTAYRFRLGDGIDASDTANALEVALLENGMQTEVFEETITEQNAAGQAFLRLFTGFMALGLLVGVAALGVISTRAVVERRQQIGMLRAIGYKRGMVSLSFLMESSFVSLLGSIIGISLGLLLSYNTVNDINSEGGTNLAFTIPWLQIAVILAITYAFSILTTFIPARQASRIYPAEALRYE